MPQQRISPTIEPLHLAKQQCVIDAVPPVEGVLFDARYDYGAKVFRGYVQRDGHAHAASVQLTPWQAGQVTSDWIHGWISPAERAALFNAAKDCPADQAIVEVGSWKGKSTVILGWGSKDGQRAPVWAIDPHEGTPLFWVLHTAGHTGSTWAQFLANIDAGGVKDVVYPLHEASHSAAVTFTDPIGVLFVDGDHKYAAFDIRDWFPLIVPGGWILLHDQNTPAVQAAVKRLHAAGQVTEPALVGNMLRMQKAEQ